MKRLFGTAVFAVALALLLLATARPTVAQEVGIKNQQAAVEGIVVPDSIHDRQPFSFAVPAGAGGSVSVQTLSGEVVERASTDKYGRVFLAAGLPTGAYMVTRGDDRRVNPLWKIEIKQAVKRAVDPQPAADVICVGPQAGGSNAQAYVDPWAWAGTDGWVPIPIDPICVAPQTLKVNDSFALSGQGFSPNAADMQVSLAGAGQSQAMPVLAATTDQLKVAPGQVQLTPGKAELKVSNSATGHIARPRPVLVYDLQGRLGRSKLTSGEQTTLEFSSLPADVPMKVRVTIFGKATFNGGRSQVEGVTEQGRLVFQVEAKKGAGDFHVDFEGVPVQRLISKAGCTCGCGGTAQPACAHKACACSKSETLTGLEGVASKPKNASSNKDKCTCGCGGTPQPACAHKACVCSK